MNMKKTALAAAVALGLGVAGAAQAAPVSTGGVFDMYSQLGLDQNPGNAITDALRASAPCGTCVKVNEDTSITGFVDYAAGTWGVASTAPFYGLTWTASGGGLITTAGNYALDTTTGHVSIAAPDTTGTGDGQMHFSVGAGQMAGFIDFAWGVTTGIRVVDVWNINADGSLTTAAVPGMENGPFPGFNAAFELTAPGLAPAPSAVPAPAAVWLFGAGMVGLMGLVRRGRKAEAAGSLSA